MKILVTGATGFVGSVLIPKLIEKFGPEAISLFVLPDDGIPKSWKNQCIKIFYGNILDQESLKEVCKNQTHVIHLAGYVSYRKKESRKIMAVNRDGTGNVVNACLSCKIERLIHISSVGAIGFRKNREPADESTPFNWPTYFYYMVSKHQGQKIVEDAVKKKGLEAIILNPASIMGPGDHNIKTPHNQLYRRIYMKPLFGSFSGGLAAVDVRDLTDIIIKALNSGEGGEKYLTVGANLTYQEVIKLIGKYSKRKVYPFKIPPFPFKAAGILLDFFSTFLNKSPFLTYSYGKLSGWFPYYSNEKSKKEFSHTYINIEKTIQDTCRYFESTFLE